jgi:uncharacterized protein involved in exopolysaccharide biosynthesis
MAEINTAMPKHKKDDEVDFGLLDLFIALAQRKSLIIGMPLIVAIVAALVSFAIPNTFLAVTRLLPPQQAQSGAAAMLAQLGGAAGAIAGGAGLKNPNDIYVGMLRSRTIADNLIGRFNLKKVYETDSTDKAREKLEANTTIVAGKDGLIEIAFENQDKALVAPVSNAYVAELVKLTKVLAVTEASQRRLFFERELERAKNSLADAEVALKQGLDARGVISVDSESRAIVETVGKLRAQVSVKEIELNSMRAFVTNNNPNFKRTEEELNSLRLELSKLENGRPESDKNSQSTESSSKSVGLQNIKILRDVKYNQMLYEMLAKQYELARLDEAKDTSIIQVLDPAITPERKYKPRRALIVIISAFLSLIFAIGFALMAEAKKRALDRPNRAAQWKKLKLLLRWR